MESKDAALQPLSLMGLYPDINDKHRDSNPGNGEEESHRSLVSTVGTYLTALRKVEAAV